MKRTWIWVAGLGLATGAQADEAMRTRIAEMLSGYEEVPRAEAIAALGPDAAAELLALAAAPGQPSHVRERATLLLGGFPTEGNHAFLVTTLSDAGAPTGIRRSAAYALVAGWPDAVLVDLEPALVATDVQLRAHGARALAKAPRTPAITDRLVALSAAETNPMVQTVVRGLLQGDAR